MIEPFWVSTFLDFPASSFDRGVAFWSAVTAYDVSPPRGARREFATLVPPDGDPFLKVQRLRDGAGRVHLDLHVPDPRAAADAAASLGATELGGDDYVVMRSPGGLTFCLVSHPASVRPRPTTWPDGTRSIADQVCIDIPSGIFDDECGFWSDLTGWALHPPSRWPEFGYIERPDDIPVRFLVQRLGESSGPVRAHVDWAAEDRVAEVQRHASLGAQPVAEHDTWTVLRDPVGSAYCVTDRTP